MWAGVAEGAIVITHAMHAWVECCEQLEYLWASKVGGGGGDVATRSFDILASFSLDTF